MESAIKKNVRHEVLSDFGNWISDDILERMRVGLENIVKDEEKARSAAEEKQKNV